jgi:hypothetical protein
MNGTILVTIVFQIFKGLMDKIMLNYLTKCFPVKKVKRKGKFKRAIEIYPDECYFISDGTKPIKHRLIDIIKNNFDCSEGQSTGIVKRFLTF